MKKELVMRAIHFDSHLDVYTIADKSGFRWELHCDGEVVRQSDPQRPYRFNHAARRLARQALRSYIEDHP